MKMLVLLKYLFGAIAIAAIAIAIIKWNFYFIIGSLPLFWAAYSLHKSILRLKNGS
jgi:hypothetical protein